MCELLEGYDSKIQASLKIQKSKENFRNVYLQIDICKRYGRIFKKSFVECTYNI